MANQPKTQHRSVRVDDDLWERAREATAANGTDRGTIIRGFLRWYVGDDDAELPTPGAAR
ncbi:hypothetical protein [Amycolatopsis sp. NPDC001319]|uniref:hypothetical protein n=1 Tax=unclassified Amycolatopsis TaxID=2618356 RepID=UPI0036BAE291